MSFNPSLANDVDWVRSLVGDTDESDEAVTDETILAVLTEVGALGASGQALKYCAAAQVGEIVAARWQARGGAFAEKSISKLRIRYADGQALKAYREYLAGLKATCTRLSLQSPQIIRAM